MVGELRSTSQRAKVSRVGGAPAGRGFRNAGTPGSTSLLGFQKVAAHQDVRFAALLRAPPAPIAKLLPDSSCHRAAIASFVVLPFGNRGSPVAEDGLHLAGERCSAGWRESRGRLAAADRPRRPARRRDREAQTAEIVVLVDRRHSRRRASASGRTSALFRRGSRWA